MGYVTSSLDTNDSVELEECPLSMGLFYIRCCFYDNKISFGMSKIGQILYCDSDRSDVGHVTDRERR